MPTAPAEDLIGRDRLLERVRTQVARALNGQRATVLVAGEAGIGKTSLIRAAAALAAERGARTAWGACVDVDGVPGYWPWTKALDDLVHSIGFDAAKRAAGDDRALLASIVPSFGNPPSGGLSPGDSPERLQLMLMDTISRFLDALAEEGPVIVVIDDLQWADESSLALLDFVTRAPNPAGVGFIGAYRPDELSAGVRRRLVDVATRGEHLRVNGLDLEAVQELIARTTGDDVARQVAANIHRRTDGHPFFVRELASIAHLDGGKLEQVPSAVRDAIERRLARLSDATVSMLEVAALGGTGVRPDVLAAVLGRSTVEVETAAQEGRDAGVLAGASAEVAFTHDLLRETILERIDAPRRVALHQAIGSALEARASRHAEATPSELAHHFTAAVSIDGPDRAVRWALAAAAVDAAGLAFIEAAGHLRRLRAAMADAGVDIDDTRRVDVLLAEADALSLAGNTVDARGLLRHAADIADRLDDVERTARVALASAQLGARFATRRDEIVRDLERAIAAASGRDDAWEARLTATLSRELQHSVPEDRTQARPLSERALELGRRAGDPSTLLACLFARHDVLWTPGAGHERADVAREIVEVAMAAGDEDHHAEGLLLLANALLEQGSAAFESPLTSCLALLDGRGQPRQRYIAATRRACIALLRGRLDDADELIEHAAAVGERIREPDTGNVRMSQRLELVRARNQPDELATFATEAVAHWTGAPVHANAVAAGFAARAGDLDRARHHVAAVLDLGTWRADRSYLWSVLVRELGVAAVHLDDRDLADALFDDLQPLTDTCGVNGAVVAFAGSHAHTAGQLAQTLGQPQTAQLLLQQAAITYRRLGAAGWLTEVDAQSTHAITAHDAPTASMRRRGAVWQLSFAGRDATVTHTKGLADIARLLAAPGTEIHVLDLIDAADRSGRSGNVIDRTALDAYRQRLADLALDAAEADRYNDPERRARVEAERQSLIDELARVTDTRGQPRQFANHPAERARKAVTGRVRDAIRKLEPVLPELAAHLQRSIVTGTYCRYRPDTTTWEIDAAGVLPSN